MTQDNDKFLIAGEGLSWVSIFRKCNVSSSTYIPWKFTRLNWSWLTSEWRQRKGWWCSVDARTPSQFRTTSQIVYSALWQVCNLRIGSKFKSLIQISLIQCSRDLWVIVRDSTKNVSQNGIALTLSPGLAPRQCTAMQAKILQLF